MVARRFRRGGGISRGFSLVETVATAAVLGLVFAIGPSALSQFLLSYRMAEMQSELQRESRAVADELVRQIRLAKKSTCEIQSAPQNQPYFSSLKFTSVTERNVVIRQEGNRLLLTDGDSVRALTEHLRCLEFVPRKTDDYPYLVNFSFTLDRSIYNGAKTISLTVQQTVLPKN